MNLIKDIRIYRSNIENADNNSLPSSFENKNIHCILHRIAMKLSEHNFSLGDFDHLYINATTCYVDGGISPANRTIDKYHPWYRYYDVEISQEFFDLLESSQCENEVIKIVEQVIQKYFSTPDFDSEKIHCCISEAVENGENMLMKFKEKNSPKNKAVIYLRYSDDARYFPLLRVWDSEDNLLLEQDLPKTQTLDAYGEIQLSSKKVTIKPRKNTFAINLEPMTFIL